MRPYKVIGIMSGSSMDGVDLAYCELWEEESKWNYRILQSETITYENKWKVRLSQLENQTSLIFAKTDTFYGHYLGQLVRDFCRKHSITPDLVSSHGHTIFHQPEAKITVQVGDGASLSAISGYPVVCNFRTTDVALGGQGAPLAGIGDELLFGDYDFCLNLGGITNISARQGEKRLAYDISPGNMVLNRIANELGKEYDEDGEIAALGTVNYHLLQKLNELDYYSVAFPKSLGREWVDSEFWPVVLLDNSSHEDKMKTICEHIGWQIGQNIEKLIQGREGNHKVLATGGGVFNKCLLEHIKAHSGAEIIVPDKDTINFKEALIFALLGILRIENKNNCLRSATGASRDNIGGALFGDFSRLINFK